jgi:hypothetical protein
MLSSFLRSCAIFLRLFPFRFLRKNRIERQKIKRLQPFQLLSLAVGACRASVSEPGRHRSYLHHLAALSV